jgi:hypothetical protein
MLCFGFHMITNVIYFQNYILNLIDSINTLRVIHNIYILRLSCWFGRVGVYDKHI